MNNQAKATATITTREPVDPMEIDPVCGTEIPREAASIDATYEGERHFFCCEACKLRFEREPARYTVSCVELA